MVLHIVVLGIAAAQVAHVVVLLGAARGRTVGVGTADKAHHKGIGAQLVCQQQAILEGVAHHIAAGETLQGHRVGAIGAHLAVHRTQHIQVVRGDLFEVAGFIGGIQAHAAQAIVATFGGALVLHQFHHGFEEQAILQFLLGRGIIEHPAAGQVGVMGNGHDIAAVVQIGAALA